MEKTIHGVEKRVENVYREQKGVRVEMEKVKDEGKAGASFQKREGVPKWKNRGLTEICYGNHGEVKRGNYRKLLGESTDGWWVSGNGLGEAAEGGNGNRVPSCPWVARKHNHFDVQEPLILSIDDHWVLI